MTLNSLDERLKEKNRPLTQAQFNYLENRFGYKADFSVIPSDVPKIEASLEKEYAFILHPNGLADKKFYADEANSLGFAYWNNYDLVFIAYF